VDRFTYSKELFIFSIYVRALFPGGDVNRLTRVRPSGIHMASMDGRLDEPLRSHSGDRVAELRAAVKIASMRKLPGAAGDFDPGANRRGQIA
jgi:hypothetical protein